MTFPPAASYNVLRLLGVIRLWLVSYGRAVVVLLIALGLGYPVARRVFRGPAAPLISLFVGLALFSVTACLLAWLRIFSALSVTVLAVVAGAVSLRFLIVDVPAWRQRWLLGSRPQPALIAVWTVLVVVLLGFSVLSLYPSNGFDATSYHLPLAMDLVRHQGLVYNPFARYSFFPQANEALFAVIMFMTGNQVAASALEFSVLAAVVLLLPSWFVAAGRRVEAGLVAALLVLASPEVIFTATTAYVDTWTLSFVLVGTLVALDAVQHRAALLPALAIAGAMVGEAAATKYTGAVFGLVGLLGALVASDRAVLSWKAPAAVAAGLAVIAAPWYAWTLHATGDPIYPLGTSVFGNRKGLWTTDELQWQKLVARGYVGPGIKSVFDRALGFLRGEAPLGDIPLGRSPLSWLLGGGFLGLLIPRAWRDRAFLGSALASALCIGVSLEISADPRYLVPALGIFALCGGLAADHVLTVASRLVATLPSRERRAGRLRVERLRPLVSVLLVIVILRSAVSYTWNTASASGRPPTSERNVRSYLSQRIACFGAVEYLNAEFGSGYRAWGYICEQARYFARGLLISDVFSTGSRRRVFDSAGDVMPSDRTLWRRLEPLHVQWVILPTQTVPHPQALQAHGLFTLTRTIGPEYVFRMDGGG
jgi:Dolichyl-phosphate-mannose-protein mannosyltransferase